MKKLIGTLIAVLFVGFSLPASAQETDGQPSWMPKPPKAVAGKCDADPAWMRKWHMRALQHKRDETMHKGIRTEKFSLQRCISCHAVKEDSGKYVTIKDERHFCRSCHDYVAVRTDCFDCHNSVPGDDVKKAARALGNPHRKMTARPAEEQGAMTRAKASRSSGHNGDTALAALQKYMAGEGK